MNDPTREPTLSRDPGLADVREPGYVEVHDQTHPHVHQLPPHLHNESSSSAVSWGAVLAGAFVAAAMALALLALGSGLGLASVSPWQNAGASARAIGWATIVFLAATQLISYALGGYIAGRLRTKWVGVHDDEVYFRDTAHGFLVWAVGVVMSAALLASAASALVGGVATIAGGASSAALAAPSAGVATGNAIQGNATASGSSNANDYLVDRLLRPATSAAQAPGASPTNTSGSAAVAASGNATATSTTDSGTVAASGNPSTPSTTAAASPAPPTPGDDTEVRAELSRVFANGMREGQLSPADRSYVAQTVAARTGMRPADAERRVDDTLRAVKDSEDRARQAADVARKAAAWGSLWIFVALLLGAFSASYFATLGGRLRDRGAY